MNIKTILNKISKKDPTWHVLLFNTPTCLENLVDVFKSYNQIFLQGEISESDSGQYMTVSQLISALQKYPLEMDVTLFTKNREKMGYNSDIESICDNGPAIQINGVIEKFKCPST
uniref:Uncharacterized protein n=1 Tax=Promethearchaeum syntrophicum TaxID=2594042 RepID=A0A5B9DEH9_9ARCH|nr:hypothetical protein [Candidatus Prometheoarchaeum syntrophicum]QEE17719.1 hypothetical protein DSAG12_03557 [Candidatus Prometheoarchaeum syntrophicum]